MIAWRSIVKMILSSIMISWGAIILTLRSIVKLIFLSVFISLRVIILWPVFISLRIIEMLTLRSIVIIIWWPVFISLRIVEVLALGIVVELILRSKFISLWIEIWFLLLFYIRIFIYILFGMFLKLISLNCKGNTIINCWTGNAHFNSPEDGSFSSDFFLFSSNLFLLLFLELRSISSWVLFDMFFRPMIFQTYDLHFH